MQVTRTRSEILTCACHIVTTSTLSSSSHPQAAAEHQPTANHTDTNSVGESTPSSSGNSSTSSEDSGNESGGSGQEEGASTPLTPSSPNSPSTADVNNDKLEYTSGEWSKLATNCFMYMYVALFMILFTAQETQCFWCLAHVTLCKVEFVSQTGSDGYVTYIYLKSDLQLVCSQRVICSWYAHEV